MNALSQRSLFPPPDLDNYEPCEVCLSSSSNNNSSTISTALTDSGSSVKNVPNQSMLTTFVPSTGHCLIAENGSSIWTFGNGYYTNIQKSIYSLSTHKSLQRFIQSDLEKKF